MDPMLLGAFAGALLVSFVACAIALQLFPRFRSGEHKEGVYRPDQSTGSFKIDTKARGLKRRVRKVSSSELPLVGGPAMILAVVGVSAGMAVALGLDEQQWQLLLILLVAMGGYALVGFLDDFFKYWRGSGISEWQKFAGVGVVSLAAAVALNRLIVKGPYSARLPYPPYSDVPWFGQILIHTHFAWIIFFLLMSVTVATSTSLATDFSDGMDGLCGGLLLSASLAFAVILINQHESTLLPLVLASLAVAGASLGYLPFNWPSSWKARGLGRGNRRAKLIMGDTGSLALGGILALVAVMSRLEPLLIIVGGVFVLEGASALISARILVKFFRFSLVLERFNSSRGFPHSEFPLPFLGTPMHHHYDLIGWDRQLIVYGAWLLSAVLGLLGIASVEGTFTWERYLARLVALVLIISVWQMGPRTRSFFIGLAPVNPDAPDAPRYLALYYGFPFRFLGLPLFGRIDSTSITEEALRGPGETLTIWQRLSVADARSLLGYYCYRAGAHSDALRIWDRIPKSNRDVRPDIASMLTELKMAQAAAEEAAGDEGVPGGDVSPEGVPSQGLGAYTPVEGGFETPGSRELAAVHADGSGTFSSTKPTDDPGSSAWNLPVPPTGGTLMPPRLQPTLGPGASDGSGHSPTGAPLWSANAWANAQGGGSSIPGAGTTGPLPPSRPSAFTPGDIYGSFGPSLGQPDDTTDDGSRGHR